MTTEPKLESYLSELDKYLAQIPVSDRADIIIEIKSHVMDAQAKKPSQDITAILNSLGDPESVAKRYLQERGIQITLPAKSSSMMWLPAAIKPKFGSRKLPSLKKQACDSLKFCANLTG